MPNEELRVLSTQEIISSLPPGWALSDEYIQKTYQTKSWLQTVMLFNCLASLAQANWHHPDVKVSYKSITVLLKTHEANGITMRDISLANEIELYFSKILQR